MIGTFTTTRYTDRAAFDAGRVESVSVSTNRFTNGGLMWMWQMMAGQLRRADGTLTDHLGAARLVVGNGDRPFDPADQRMVGDQTAEAAIDQGFPTITGPVADSEGVERLWRITFRATFGEREAAFDWQERGVVTEQGVLLDRAVLDQGRKVLGSIWTLEASLDLSR